MIAVGDTEAAYLAGGGTRRAGDMIIAPCDQSCPVGQCSALIVLDVEVEIAKVSRVLITGSARIAVTWMHKHRRQPAAWDWVQ